MASLKQIRQRIRSAKNIQQITKAMKLVAAARLKKATDRVLEARPYSERLYGLMSSLSRAGELPAHPLMYQRPIHKYAVVLITADRGLAGSYNTNIIRKAGDFLKQTEGSSSLVTVGKKGSQFFARRGYNVVHSHSVPTAGARLDDAIAITNLVRDMFVSGEVDAVYVAYSKFYSAIRQAPQVVQVLPITPPAEDGVAADSVEYKFEPDPVSILGALLPRYLLTIVWQAMLEATASEHGSRMTAMTSATDNAGEMIQELTLKANRERQASITKEILEVVGGAEALKG
ncbi:MAG: ATP synthase F1 subunit gamma [Fimbriimonadaceae bacterium]|nr:ATP synthase F1 subunit gamma [Fimbriimonadaceae bacterium]